MEIETERLILRPFREEDLDDEFSIVGDSEKAGMTLQKEYRNPENRDLLTTVYVVYNRDEQTHRVTEVAVQIPLKPRI